MSASAREFALAPMSAAPWLVMGGTAVAVLVLVLALPDADVSPAGRAGVALVAALLLALPLLAMRRRRIALDGDLLLVWATFYTRRVPVAALDLARARVVDLAEHTDYAPMLGINRFGLPGLAAGHFLLRNRARAFCLLTDRRRVLVLPQRDGPTLLLSPERPRDLLDALGAMAGGGRRR